MTPELFVSTTRSTFRMIAMSSGQPPNVDPKSTTAKASFSLQQISLDLVSFSSKSRKQQSTRSQKEVTSTMCQSSAQSKLRRHKGITTMNTASTTILWRSSMSSSSQMRYPIASSRSQLSCISCLELLWHSRSLSASSDRFSGWECYCSGQVRAWLRNQNLKAAALKMCNFRRNQAQAFDPTPRSSLMSSKCDPKPKSKSLLYKLFILDWCPLLYHITCLLPNRHLKKLTLKIINKCYSPTDFFGQFCLFSISTTSHPLNEHFP